MAANEGSQVSEKPTFSKGDVVLLPQYVRRGGTAKGIIASVEGDEMGFLNGQRYYPVELQKVTRPSYRRRAVAVGEEKTTPDIVYIDANDLRLDVEHPQCPSCRCQPQADIEDDDDEDPEDL